jgi:dTMP kinase
MSYLIAIEGGDGCGTTTHAQILSIGLKNWISIVPKLYLNDSGFDGEIIVLKSPSNSSFGLSLKEKFEKKILKDPIESTMSFALDRLEQYNSETKTYLEKGKIVIFDRYIFSSMVHQELQGAPLEFIAMCNSSIPKPDLTFHLNSDYKTIKNRILNRHDDPMIDCDLENEIKSQINSWNLVWEKSANINFINKNFNLVTIDTSLNQQESANKILACATCNILNKMLENSKKS